MRIIILLCFLGLLSLERAYASCPAPLTDSRDSIAFPKDAGLIDVTKFGAVPDDGKDDTYAIMMAIAASRGDNIGTEIFSAPLYFPPGTYDITQPIEKRNAKGEFTSGLIIQGAGRDVTVLRLKDNLPFYGDAQTPRAVIFTSSQLWGQGGPFGGGKNWPRLGEGNQAFQNSVRDITIDVGKGNPGAIGIDYLANNEGSLRHVRICSEDNSAQTGLALTRKWPGPALVTDVEINGFAVGIDIAGRDYGMTFDHVQLRNIRDTGLRNRGNAVSMSSISIEGAPHPVTNDDPGGLIAVRALSAGSAEAMPPPGNRGLYVLAAGSKSGVWQGTKKLPAASLEHLPPFEDFPQAIKEPVRHWQGVDVGSGERTAAKDSEAFKDAMSSGAHTIYIPYGLYHLDRPIPIPASVERIVGNNASIDIAPGFAAQMASGATGAFVTEGETEKPLVIEDLHPGTSLTDKAARARLSIFRHAAARPLVLADILSQGWGSEATVSRDKQGGALFLDDVSGTHFIFEGPAPVYARQLNSEGDGVRIVNDGTPLWILGVKSEGVNTLLETRGKGRSIVWGGMVYPLTPVPAQLPLFSIANGVLTATVVQSQNGAQDRYLTTAAGGSGPPATLEPAAGTRFLSFGLGGTGGR